MAFILSFLFANTCALWLRLIVKLGWFGKVNEAKLPVLPINDFPCNTLYSSPSFLKSIGQYEAIGGKNGKQTI